MLIDNYNPGQKSLAHFERGKGGIAMLVIDVGVKFRTVSVKCANIIDQDNPGQKSLAHLVEIA
jgi:hypothetical protein